MTLDTAENLAEFVKYALTLKGDEKGEAQVFLERMFLAFGHKGYKEAGAELEHRIKRKGGGTGFADLRWENRLLLEMKKRGERLHTHYRQAFEYWINSVPHRPRYVVLCNFDEFWIYDFDLQLEEPVDRVKLIDLPKRYIAFNFLFPGDKEPQFNNNRVDVTRQAADKVAAVFNAMVTRGENREQAQRFILQCVVSMFSDDFNLLPGGLFSELLEECKKGKSTYDLLGALFNQMNSAKPAKGGRFQDVQYFNGGIFKIVDPVELKTDEIQALALAAEEDWSTIHPAIFGTIFQQSMDQKQRHALGVHYTSEADIQKVVLPTIVRPWTQRVEGAKTFEELLTVRADLGKFQVLDPACGSGNFLYVAYRELKRVEAELLSRMNVEFKRGAKRVGTSGNLSLRQFHGIDISPFGVELAKVTLILAKELAIREVKNLIRAKEFDSQEEKGTQRLRDMDIELDVDRALPLENLDDNIRCADALFRDWPRVDASIGNPPYQSKNKMQQELGRAYINKVRDKYPDVPGRADYCVYWFRRAHDELPEGGRAGLVGTKTIRENYSREGGLDYIVKNNGTITEAVSTQAWSGEAAVHVSIVNWLKGTHSGKKKLFHQAGDRKDSPWQITEVDRINSSLSTNTDTVEALRLQHVINSNTCFQGQTHGQKGFLLKANEALDLIRKDEKYSQVLHPYLTTNEMVKRYPPLPQRYVIDFHPRDINESSKYTALFESIKRSVLPVRERAALLESKRNRDARGDNPSARTNHHHENFLKRWWLLSWAREELIAKINNLNRYAVCGQLTKRPIFEFIHRAIRPNAQLIVFTFEDDYSFGVLQSNTHWSWFTEKCSKHERRFRYTSDTVYDTFPWPQAPKLASVRSIAKAAAQLRVLRNKVMTDNRWGYRQLYRTLELPGANPLKDAHEELDQAVREAYGASPKEDILAFLLALNQEVAEKEKKGEKVVGPGLPPIVKDSKPFITQDCVSMPP